MNDKELLEYMRKVDKNFNKHLENGTIEMSLEYYNLCEKLMARGINAMQENQQLKEQQKEDIINKAKNLILPLKTESPYNVITETFKKELLEILDNKGE